MLRPLLALLALCCAAPALAQAPPPGTIRGSFAEASPEHLARTWNRAVVALPDGWSGRMEAVPPQPEGRRLPTVIFMGGSSGFAWDGVEQFMRWLAATAQVAVIGPDSFATPDRLAYVSPVPVAIYERIHAMRTAELSHALERARALPWVDPARVAVGGSSEGSVPVARLIAPVEPAGRFIASWNCEAGYFVDAPRVMIPREGSRVLSLVASRDPFFSPLNPWNAGFGITGNCATALRMHRDATNIVFASDLHTLIDQDFARAHIVAFLARVLAPR
jgi:hypothetical protein